MGSVFNKQDRRNLAPQSGCPSVQLTDQQAQEIVEGFSIFSPSGPEGQMQFGAFCCDQSKVSSIAQQLNDPQMPRYFTVVSKKSSGGTRYFMLNVDPILFPMSFLFNACNPQARNDSVNWNNIPGMNEVIRMVNESEKRPSMTIEMNISHRDASRSGTINCREVSVSQFKEIIIYLYKRGYQLRQIVRDNNSNTAKWERVQVTEAPPQDNKIVGCRGYYEIVDDGGSRLGDDSF